MNAYKNAPPLQGLIHYGADLPRALPWAGMGWAFSPHRNGAPTGKGVGLLGRRNLFGARPATSLLAKIQGRLAAVSLFNGLDK